MEAVSNTAKHVQRAQYHIGRKLGEQLPDWKLIDEISVPLLEQGVGTFEILQRALPSVVFAKIDEIENNSTSASAAGCTTGRLLKLFRISQLQVQYILQTQQELVEKLEKAEQKLGRCEKENKVFRKTLLKHPSSPFSSSRAMEHSGGHKELGGEEEEEQFSIRPRLYQCNGCSKIFLHEHFLVSHIKRQHSGNLAQCVDAPKRGHHAGPPHRRANRDQIEYSAEELLMSQRSRV